MKMSLQTLTKETYSVVNTEVKEFTTLQAKKYGEENGFTRVTPTKYVKETQDYKYILIACK